MIWQQLQSLAGSYPLALRGLGMTVVLSLISVAELTRAGQLLASDRFMPAEGFITVAAFYLLLYYCLKGLAALSGRWLGLRPARGRA
jgi:polar amino acid transport system permease protein